MEDYNLVISNDMEQFKMFSQIFLNPFTGDCTVTISDINGLYFIFFCL